MPGPLGCCRRKSSNLHKLFSVGSNRWRLKVIIFSTRKLKHEENQKGKKGRVVFGCFENPEYRRNRSVCVYVHSVLFAQSLNE